MNYESSGGIPNFLSDDLMERRQDGGRSRDISPSEHSCALEFDVLDKLESNHSSSAPQTVAPSTGPGFELGDGRDRLGLTDL